VFDGRLLVSGVVPHEGRAVAVGAVGDGSGEGHCAPVRVYRIRHAGAPHRGHCVTDGGTGVDGGAAVMYQSPSSGSDPPRGGTPDARHVSMTHRPTSTSMIPADGFPAAYSLAARA